MTATTAETITPRTSAPLHPWRPLYWEPVDGTGERLMVGVLHAYNGQVGAVRILRDDVLDALYGHAADGARNLIDKSLELYRAVASASSVADAGVALLALHPGPLRSTEAASVGELLHTAALLYSSLASLDKFDELQEADAPQQEEVNRRFSTEVREIITNQRPDLQAYFGRTTPLIDGGAPVRFGYCSPRVVAHFSVLHPVRQSTSVRDARARLWEVARAMEITAISTGLLVWAVPRPDDATLGQKQRANAAANIREIEREADPHHIRLLPVHTAQDGAARLLEYA